jgi:hypothetical protein
LDLPKSLIKEREVEEQEERRSTFDFCEMYREFESTIELEGGD